jgi:hypothetical protein
MSMYFLLAYNRKRNHRAGRFHLPKGYALFDLLTVNLEWQVWSQIVDKPIYQMYNNWWFGTIQYQSTLSRSLFFSRFFFVLLNLEFFVDQ